MNKTRGVRHRLNRPGLICSVATLVLLAACGGTSSSGGGLGSGPLLEGVLAPFSGADASFGPRYLAGCIAASLSINGAGGIGGRQVSCQQFDTKGEPADAVPAARAMIAGNSNLMGVVGCTSDEASTVVPILDGSHIPMFCMTGQSEFNKTTAKYFHRLVPADSFDAYAMIGSALFGPGHAPYKRVALVFGDDIGSQTFVGPATTALTKLGVTIAINQAIKLGAPSYRTEVAKLLQTNPDVILTETIGSAGTYMKEVKQQNGGKVIPFIGTSATIDPVWFKQVRDAIGLSDFLANYQAVDLKLSLTGSGYDEFVTQLTAAESKDPGALTYKGKSPTVHLYDGIIMTALAMVATNSSDRKVYNPKIIEIANGVSGATVVSTFKQGIDALKAGKSIRYVGAAGENNFNQYNNSQQGYNLVTMDKDGNEVVLGSLSQSQTQQIIDAGGNA
ncbi:MAG: ABC transporter substrate-binding protein [Candidatus Dormibacteraeota bacterium]|nr:ABC transporter substrate-binding protein [Candidatus Dormibacteraeota bacterium]